MKTFRLLDFAKTVAPATLILVFVPAATGAQVPESASNNMTADVPGLIEGPPPQVFVSCLAITADALFRSDLIPLGGRQVVDIERRWRRYVDTRAPAVSSSQCEAAKTPGKVAAYSDLDRRLRSVGAKTGVHSVRYTSWRD